MIYRPLEMPSKVTVNILSAGDSWLSLGSGRGRGVHSALRHRERLIGMRGYKSQLLNLFSVQVQDAPHGGGKAFVKSLFYVP